MIIIIGELNHSVLGAITASEKVSCLLLVRYASMYMLTLNTQQRRCSTLRFGKKISSNNLTRYTHCLIHTTYTLPARLFGKEKRQSCHLLLKHAWYLRTHELHTRMPIRGFSAIQTILCDEMFPPVGMNTIKGVWCCYLLYLRQLMHFCISRHTGASQPRAHNQKSTRLELV